MRCSSCGFENATGIKFCGGCGAPLKLKCLSCGFDNALGIKFCGECGKSLTEGANPAPAPDPRSYTRPKHLADKILTTRSALEGERKQVTVLFVDVKGSMDLGEKVDPEEWYRIMDRFFQILSDGVYRFEGTVDKFTGDGIMAIFGAPIAHEDHARRACYAALHLKEELRRYAEELKRTRGLSFAVRMGLNSGEVVVGTIGDDLKMVYTAHGNTVGLGQRMEQLATPDQVYLTENSAKLVSGFFRLRDLGPFELKGVSAPVRVSELEGVGTLHTPLEVSRSRGFSRFVGRADEMASLEAALERALDGNGQVVGIVGEPGVGKSRLCQEFVERCQARGISVYGGHGVSHGKAIPYLPILELFRGFFGISERDNEKAAREKIAGRMLALDESLRDALPLLFEFLGVADPEHPAPRMDPDARRRQLFASVKRVAQARSRREPAVTLLEDLHWFDPGSEAFVEVFVEATAGTRTLLVVNFRPEFHAGWMQKSYYQQVPLLPLSVEAAGKLLHELLSTDPSLARLGNRILERTGGNPFFIEEIVQALAESGSLVGSRGAYQLVQSDADLVLPATVQAVLAARIDRLAEREKEVLQTAAVIGKEVPEPTLKRVSGAPAADVTNALRSLVTAEFLYEQAGHPEAQYTFKHPLTQEVAYHSQLGAHRARLHGRVARVVQELYPDKLDERAALLAHHLEHAGETLDAARWHRRAARWAGVHDHAGALRHWQRARALLATMPESQEVIRLRLGCCPQILIGLWYGGASEDEAAIIFKEGRELADRAADLRSLAFLNATYANIRLAHGAADYLDYAREAARLADGVGDLRMRLVAYAALMRCLQPAGLLSEAVMRGENLLKEAGEDRSLEVFFVRSIQLPSLALVGRWPEAVASFQREIQRAHEDRQLDQLGWACAEYGDLCSSLGDAQAALDHARQGVEIAEKVGDPLMRTYAYFSLGLAHRRVGSYAEAVTVLERARTIVQESHTGLEYEPSIASFLASAYVDSGDMGRALRSAEEAVTLVRQRRLRHLEPWAHLALGYVLLRARGLESRNAIEAALGDALRSSREIGMKMSEPFIVLERAELARLSGDETTCQRELREAHRLFLEMGAPVRAAEVARELGLATVFS
jgi:class 3 adenylate cyclase/tetratricopeptide (TPR) repeat protein